MITHYNEAYTKLDNPMAKVTKVFYPITDVDSIEETSLSASGFSIVINEQEIIGDLKGNRASFKFKDIPIIAVIFPYYYDVLVNGQHAFSVCYDISEYKIDNKEEESKRALIESNHVGSSLNMQFNDGKTYKYLINSDERLVKITYNDHDYYFNIKPKLYWTINGHTVCFRIDENDETIESKVYFDGDYAGGCTSYKNKVELRKYDESLLDKYKYYELSALHEGPQKGTFEDIMASDNHRLELYSKSQLCYMPDLLKKKLSTISPKQQKLLDLLEANKDKEDVAIDYNAQNFADMVHYVQGLLVEYDPNDKSAILEIASRYDCQDFFIPTLVQV
jgi:hypothetical protein